MPEFKHKAGTLSWDPQTRVAFHVFLKKTRPTGADAKSMVEAMTLWVGTKKEPFALLSDCENLNGTDADYRSIWGDFFRRHREHSFSALFNTSPEVQITTEMFALGTGLPMKAFGDEKAARAWLREKGIKA